jgi:hypothetical protein
MGKLPLKRITSNTQFDFLNKTHIVLLILILIIDSSKAFYASELKISVQKTDWGNACVEDITSVLYSTGWQIWKYCPNSKIDEIFVKRRSDYPQMDWDRDSNNKIVIGLMTGVVTGRNMPTSLPTSFVMPSRITVMEKNY